MVSTNTHANPAGGRRARLRIVCPGYPALNIYSRPAKVMTALGPICVATAVGDVPGWDAEVIDENNYSRGPIGANGRPDHVALQQTRPADVVGLYGGLTSTIPRLFEIAQLYKGLGVRVIVGGNHFVEDNIEIALHSGADIVVVGEGEQTIAELLPCLSSGGDLAAIRGIAFLRDGKCVQTPLREPMTDFDALPVPDFSLLRNATLRVYPVSTTRGCGMNCEFCAVKGKPRSASAERMLEQFTSVYEKWGGTSFFVTDDLFGQNRPATMQFLAMVRDYQRQAGIRFGIMVQIRLDKARDTELLEAMREAGIDHLAIGYESPVAEELKAMDKHLNPQEMVNLTRTYRRAGFRVHGMFIFGYPARNGKAVQVPVADRVRQFRDFIRKSRVDTIQVLLPIPLPGTEFAARLRKENRIFPVEQIGWEYYDGNFPIIQPDAPLTPDLLQDSAQKIMGKFYRFGSLLAMIFSIISLPVIALRFYRIKSAWRSWCGRWWTNLYRTFGWLLMKKWTAAFKKDGFMGKLAAAKRSLVPTRAEDHGS